MIPVPYCFERDDAADARDEEDDLHRVVVLADERAPARLCSAPYSARRDAARWREPECRIDLAAPRDLGRREAVPDSWRVWDSVGTAVSWGMAASVLRACCGCQPGGYRVGLDALERLGLGLPPSRRGAPRRAASPTVGYCGSI